MSVIHRYRGGAVRAALLLTILIPVGAATARQPAPLVADCGFVARRVVACPPGLGQAECRLRRRLTRQRCRALTRGFAPPLHIVTVNADGTFTPENVTINSGDMVMWEFDIATHYTDAIIPIEDKPDGFTGCPAKAFDRDDPNEFTGPLPRAASGVFVINPSEEPYTIDDDLWTDDFTGLHIRLPWRVVNPAPGEYDWSVLDDQMDRAVEHGKLFMISFKAGDDGTPDWIFDEAIVLPEGPIEVLEVPGGLPRGPGRTPRTREITVKELLFRDAGAHPPGTGCGSRMSLGSPTDPAYRIRYFMLLKAAADHIKSKNTWYRSLAHIKLSGANLHSAESRLPKRCWSPTGSGQTADECGCVARGAGDPPRADSCVCNPQVWATEGGYTPGGLYEFYRLQAELLAEEFPDKDMSFMLIQDGWPEINDDGEYSHQDLVNADGEYVGGLPAAQNPLSSSVDQLNALLDQGAEEHGSGFLVQHNGLRPEPQYEGETPCEQSGRHPTHGPFDTRGACPNRYALLAGVRNGSITGFQTVNSFFDPIGDLPIPPVEGELPLARRAAPPPSSSTPLQDLDHERLKDSMGWTFWNAYYNTGAVWVEIYEYMLAELAGEDLAGMTFREWAEVFHNRRRQPQFSDVVADPFPQMHAHIFQHTGAPGRRQVLEYVHGLRCHEADAPRGRITIRPN